ncbi:hypothetical protein BpHYR1_020271 [Brachionus plicatilis]|uniref:Uncharacterized protein n=1 Tax=Brachionus plicatilis TaxID=10195 RepID=A0A3M7PN25_BRAPC|nr:hypothetical protein BpHYR1_020271 [Brachionus plicatilis]
MAMTPLGQIAKKYPPFLALKCLDKVILNEIKINPNDLDFYLNFKNYISLVRNKHCGGLAFLVKEGIELKQYRTIVYHD